MRGAEALSRDLFRWRVFRSCHATDPRRCKALPGNELSSSYAAGIFHRFGWMGATSHDGHE